MVDLEEIRAPLFVRMTCVGAIGVKIMPGISEEGLNQKINNLDERAITPVDKPTKGLVHQGTKPAAQLKEALTILRVPDIGQT